MPDLSPAATTSYVRRREDKASPCLRDTDCFHMPCWGIGDCYFIHKTQVRFMQHFLSSMITYLTLFPESSHVPGIGNRTTNRRFDSRAECALGGGLLK